MIFIGEPPEIQNLREMMPISETARRNIAATRGGAFGNMTDGELSSVVELTASTLIKREPGKPTLTLSIT
jgi:hypothetical protein